LNRTETPRPDLELARAALAGEGLALADFAERMACVPQMLAALNRRLGNPLAGGDLDDLAQEALIRVWAKLPGFAGLSALETWVYPFCYLEFMNALRRRRRLGRMELSGDLGQATGGTAAVGAFEFERLHLALERLPAGEAQVLRLKCFEELTFDEIGTRLGIPLNTAKTHFYRGLARLRQALAREGREETLR
jgi:RNA polymerase sigma-70 factor (ECF subfamily)